MASPKGERSGLEKHLLVYNHWEDRSVLYSGPGF